MDGFAQLKLMSEVIRWPIRDVDESSLCVGFDLRNDNLWSRERVHVFVDTGSDGHCAGICFVFLVEVIVVFD
jgi:hypothetical protein